MLSQSNSVQPEQARSVFKLSEVSMRLLILFVMILSCDNWRLSHAQSDKPMDSYLTSMVGKQATEEGLDALGRIRLAMIAGCNPEEWLLWREVLLPTKAVIPEVDGFDLEKESVQIVAVITGGGNADDNKKSTMFSTVSDVIIRVPFNKNDSAVQASAVVRWRAKNKKTSRECVVEVRQQLIYRIQQDIDGDGKHDFATCWKKVGENKGVRTLCCQSLGSGRTLQNKES